ncbi:MAG: type II toxin-antitoxin system RelE/ParE family toxin [Bacteroidia bacterium]|nr:type II toxin-antitoxin system RelE/ParE family toxin [Bacteroidia bacterium]
MVLKFEKKFYRDLCKISDKELIKSILPQIIENVKQAKDISEINGLKQLEKYSVRYRIKIKIDDKRTYRIGVIIRGNVVWFVRLLHRRKIYKEFP